VLDYNSQDDLATYIQCAQKAGVLEEGTTLAYNKYAGRDYYHLAHAWNLAALLSTGEYIGIMGADALPKENYVAEARKLIADGAVWMRGPHYKGILFCQRQEFIQSGGYDERFEMYGSEDRDFEARLTRRGSQFGLMPDGAVRTVRTRNRDKVRNFRLKLSKREMILQNKAILRENNAARVLVANQGRKWGQWSGQ
jgi:hypothetical protein